MIYDQIANIQKYMGISENLDKAFNFIISTDLKSLPPGEAKVDGEKLFVNVMSVEGSEGNSKYFEVHEKYIDIQIDLDGTEMIEIGIGGLEEKIPMNEETDCGFYEAGDYVPCILGEGRFLVLMPGEVHKPMVKIPGLEIKKKCVFKVLQ